MGCMSNKCSKCKMPNPDFTAQCVYCGAKISKKRTNYYPKIYPEKRYKNPYENVKYGETGEIVYDTPWKGVIKFLIIVIVIALISYYLVNQIQEKSPELINENEIINTDSGSEEDVNESLIRPDGAPEIEKKDVPPIQKTTGYYYDDDGERDSAVFISSNVEYALKYIYVNYIPSYAEKATVEIYAKCFGEQKNNLDITHKLKINNKFSIAFNPIFDFENYTYKWASYEIPLEYIEEGANEIYFTYYENGNIWGSYEEHELNTVAIGIDLDTDYNKSLWYSEGNYGHSGELMIRLIIE